MLRRLIRRKTCHLFLLNLMIRIENRVCDRTVKILWEAVNPDPVLGWRPNLAPLFLVTWENLFNIQPRPKSEKIWRHPMTTQKHVLSWKVSRTHTLPDINHIFLCMLELMNFYQTWYDAWDHVNGRFKCFELLVRPNHWS